MIKKLLFGNWVARLAWLMMLSWPMMGSKCYCFYTSCMDDVPTGTIRIRDFALFDFESVHIKIFENSKMGSDIKWYTFGVEYYGTRYNFALTQPYDSNLNYSFNISAPFTWNGSVWFLGANKDSTLIDVNLMGDVFKGSTLTDVDLVGYSVRDTFFRVHDITPRLKIDEFLKKYPSASDQDYRYCRQDRVARTGRHVRIRSIEGGYLITSYYNGSENFADTSSNNSPYPCHFIVDNKRNVSLYFPSYIDSVVVKDTIYVTKKVVQNDVTSFELYKNGIYFSKIKDPLIYDDFQNLNGDPKEIEINAKKYSRILNGVY